MAKQNVKLFNLENVRVFLDNAVTADRYLIGVRRGGSIPEMRSLKTHLKDEFGFNSVVMFAMMALEEGSDITAENAKNNLLESCVTDSERRAVEFVINSKEDILDGCSLFLALKKQRRELYNVGLRTFAKIREPDKLYEEYTRDRLRKYENKEKKRNVYPDILAYNLVLEFYGIDAIRALITACCISYTSHAEA